MHDEDAAADSMQRADEVANKAVVVLPIDADAMLDSHRDPHRILHRLDAISDQRRLSHQTRAERAALHALRRAAAIEIDFIVAITLAQSCRVRQFIRLAAA